MSSAQYCHWLKYVFWHAMLEIFFEEIKKIINETFDKISILYYGTWDKYQNNQKQTKNDFSMLKS